MQAKRLQLDGPDRNDRLERKRKSRFGDEEDFIPEKTLVAMVSFEFFLCASERLVRCHNT